MIDRWKKIASAPVNDYQIFSTRRDRRVSPRTGEEHDLFVIESQDWVNVVPLTDDEQVVCIRQYRFGIEEVTLEIPGGIVDPGEDPADAAVRELKEETGFAADRLRSLGQIAPNPAVQNNRCHFYLAEGCRLSGATSLDDKEDIEVVLVPLSDIPRRLHAGEMVHALVAVAFYKLELDRKLNPQR